MSDPAYQSKAGIRSFIAFGCGILFAVGLSIGGMLDQRKIIGFLDILNNWDPQLLFVMVGALAIQIPAYRFMKKKSHPVFDGKKYIPPGKDITRDVLVGSAIFGVGWALSGYCPGPGIVSSADGNWSAVTFVIAMTVGMATHHFFKQLFYQED